MDIQIKRIYEEPSPSDGYRVLVDRLWPRGISKEKAQLDEWAKEIAPSAELRKWFHEDRSRWTDFKKKYFKELVAQRKALDELAGRIGRRRVTLLYASADPGHNHAEVLKEHLLRQGYK